MSDITASIVVNSLDTIISIEEHPITIAPEDNQIRFYLGGYATPAGNPNEVQFNNGGILAGDTNFKYFPGNATIIASNILVSNANINTIVNPVNFASNIAPIGILTDNYYYANGDPVDFQQPGGSNTELQYNDGNGNFGASSNLAFNPVTNILSVGGNIDIGTNYYIGNGALLDGISPNRIYNTDSNVEVLSNGKITMSAAGNSNIVLITGAGANINGYLDVGNATNLKVFGGLNGYFLQTDGTGNLTWAASAGNVTGNGVPGGANTQVQYNDGGNFGGAVGFTFDNTSNLLSVPGNINVAGTVIGNLQGPIINLAYGIENISLIGSQSGTYNFDFIDNSIRFCTANASSNVILNFRGNSTISANNAIANSKSITCTYVLKTGSLAYYITDIQIDSVSQNVNWLNGVIPTTIFNNSYTSYTFTIIKNSTTPTYIVLGSTTRYAE